LRSIDLRKVSHIGEEAFSSSNLDVIENHVIETLNLF
jgi:hypothetical protein